MNTATLYAIRQPTTCNLSKMHGLQKQDVCLYADKECKELKVRFDWQAWDKPTHNYTKRIVVDGSAYNVEWL